MDGTPELAVTLPSQISPTSEFSAPWPPLSFADFELETRPLKRARSVPSLTSPSTLTIPTGGLPPLLENPLATRSVCPPAKRPIRPLPQGKYYSDVPGLPPAM